MCSSTELEHLSIVFIYIHHLADPGKFELLPDAVANLKYLQKFGYNFEMITNQSIINRGLATLEQVKKLTRESCNFFHEKESLLHSS